VSKKCTFATGSAATTVKWFNGVFPSKGLNGGNHDSKPSRSATPPTPAPSVNPVSDDGGRKQLLGPESFFEEGFASGGKVCRIIL
jgi:hypothetical protein